MVGVHRRGVLVLAQQPLHPAGHRLHDGGQHGAPGQVDQHLVEGRVRLHGGAPVGSGQSGVGALHRRVQPVEVFVGCSGHDPPTQDAFQRLAHLEERLDVLVVEAADHHPPGGPLVDEPFVRQLPQCLADRDPGDAEPVGELALHEAIAGAELPTDDELPDRLAHRVAHRSRRRFLARHHCHSR